MKLNFNSRLKEYLINLIIREEDEDAWQHLKTLNPNNDDLCTIITDSKFVDDAWEILKQQSPSENDLVFLVVYSTKKEEAKDLLLAQLPLDNENLAKIIEHTNNDEAAKILLTQNPSQEELITILKYSNMKDEAATLLLKQEVDNYDLKDIIEHSSLKLEAWEVLLKQNPDIDDFHHIICYTDLEEIAWEELLRRNPSNKDLLNFVNDYGETGRKRIEATKLIFAQNPNADILTSIIDNNILTDEAFELLAAMNPSSDDLSWIIWRANIKVDECADLSLKSNPDKQQLLEIFEYSNRKDAAAEFLVEMPLETSELANIVLFSSNKKAIDLLSERTNFYWSSSEEQELILQIKTKLLQNPDLLDVNNWHNGEKHCLGGWAITLNEAAQNVEKQFSSEIAACLLLPNFTHLFFIDKTSVLQALENIAI